MAIYSSKNYFSNEILSLSDIRNTSYNSQITPAKLRIFIMNCRSDHSQYGNYTINELKLFTKNCKVYDIVNKIDIFEYFEYKFVSDFHKEIDNNKLIMNPFTDIIVFVLKQTYRGSGIPGFTININEPESITLPTFFDSKLKQKLTSKFVSIHLGFETIKNTFESYYEGHPEKYNNGETDFGWILAHEKFTHGFGMIINNIFSGSNELYSLMSHRPRLIPSDNDSSVIPYQGMEDNGDGDGEGARIVDGILVEGDPKSSNQLLQKRIGFNTNKPEWFDLILPETRQFIIALSYFSGNEAFKKGFIIPAFNKYSFVKFFPSIGDNPLANLYSKEICKAFENCPFFIYI
ncbi:MAG: hypothetical protein Q8R57_03860 [Bacteroidota bacterium]|nr:hypothetical protein [Bacteroidota bacterium]